MLGKLVYEIIEYTIMDGLGFFRIVLFPHQDLMIV